MPKAEFNLAAVIEGCLNSDRNSQRMLYEHFYGYAMSICQRYTSERDKSVEMLNDAFLKVFNSLYKYDPELPFKGWLRRILINTAIDHYRKTRQLPVNLGPEALENTPGEDMPLPVLSPDEDVLPVLQQLSPAYRLIFNLYVMEGYRHEEIAEMTGISASTSRSNLVRAIAVLRAVLIRDRPQLIKSY